VLVVRAVCPPAAGPLEDYAVCFDESFSRLAQRRGFREYLTGLLAPRDRNKTLTGLAGAEPVTGAQHAAVQRLQYFVSQSTWDADEVNRRRLELLVNAPATAPHGRGVIAIDDSGDRKDGTATAHVGRQWLARVSWLAESTLMSLLLREGAEGGLVYKTIIPADAQSCDRGRIDDRFG
jgi:SRSO17 transposase